MPPKSGNVFLLKEGDGQPTEVFTTVAGLRANAVSLAGAMVDVSDKDSLGIRELLAGGGQKTLTLTGDGVFEDHATQTNFRDRVKTGAIHNYQMDDGTTVIEGPFQVTQFEHSGDQDAEQLYTVTLESAGDWTIA